jgi:hypothetical protein
MRFRSQIWALVFVAVTAGSTFAAPIGFATDTNTDLYSVDFGASSATLIGNTGQFFESIAQAPNGTLYGATSGGILYSINATTGAATLIGNTGLGNIEGLDFNGNTLLATNFNATPSVYSLNLATAAATLVVTAGSPTGLVRSMTVLDANTLLVRGDLGGNTLFSLNLGTGAVAAIGAQADTIFGMDFLSNGSLYGLSDQGQMYLINGGTGALTLIGDTGDQFWLSLTGATVPAPAALPLLGLGLAGLAAWRRKR